MNKYVAIFCVPAGAMKDWMATVDEATRKEQSEKMMQEWTAWRDAHKAAIVEEGLPLGKTKRVTKDGITDTKNDMNWYMILQAESHDAAAKMVQSNPHLQMIPSAYLEVMDANHRPGM